MKFGYSTHASNPAGPFYSYGVTRARHTYGAHTRLGKRTVWKELFSRDLGKFPTRAEAQAAGKTWVAGKAAEAAARKEARGA